METAPSESLLLLLRPLLLLLLLCPLLLLCVLLREVQCCLLLLHLEWSLRRLHGRQLLLQLHQLGADWIVRSTHRADDSAAIESRLMQRGGECRGELCVGLLWLWLRKLCLRLQLRSLS